MVNFNPGLSQILNKVFFSQNMQLELTKYCLAFTARYNNNTKCYSKQYVGRKITKTEQNFNPGLALIDISGIGYLIVQSTLLTHFSNCRYNQDGYHTMAPISLVKL